MGVRITEAAAVEQLRVVEEGLFAVRSRRELLDELAECLDLRFFDVAKFSHLLWLISVVGEAVCFAFHAGDMRHNREGAQGKGHDTRAVGLERQTDEIEHQLGFVDDLVRVGNVFGLRIINGRLWPMLPSDASLEASFEFAHALKVLVEFGSIFGCHGFFKVSGFIEDEVEHATTRLNFSEGCRFFLRSACDEEVSVEAAWAAQRGNSDAGARDGKGVAVVVAIFYRKCEGRKPVLQSDAFGGKLIQ